MEIIGVDNGYGLTKTVHSVFPTALQDNGGVKPPFLDNVVTYDGHYYVIAGERMKIKEDKTVDDGTFHLTLAAIGEELQKRGKSNERDIVLSVGLPLERCGAGADSFKKYFLRDKTIEFDWKSTHHAIDIKDVLVSPQGYSAIISEIDTIPNSTVIVDIGSHTIDVCQLINNIPQVSFSLNDGVITCMIEINDAIRRESNNEVMESQIQEIMMGKYNALPEKYSLIAQQKCREYAAKVAQTLQERKLNLETLPFVILGGGSNIIKNYGMDMFANVRIISDINANAVGYEMIANKIYKK